MTTAINWTKTETGYSAEALGGKFTATRVPGRWFKLSFGGSENLQPVNWTKRMTLADAKHTADLFIAQAPKLTPPEGEQSADPSVDTASAISPDHSVPFMDRKGDEEDKSLDPRMTPGHPMCGMGPTDEEIADYETDMKLVPSVWGVDPEPEEPQTDPDLDPDKIAEPTYVPGHVPPGGDDDPDPVLEPTPLEPAPEEQPATVPAVPGDWLRDPPGGECGFRSVLDRLHAIRACAWNAGAHVRTVKVYPNPRTARRAG